MPSVWFVLKRSLRCKSEHREVHDPNATGIRSSVGRRSGCSRSITNLKDVVIHGSRRHAEKGPICSPRSAGSSELLNSVTHRVLVSNSSCELKVSAGAGFQEGGGVSDFVGMLNPGNPGPTGFHVGRSHMTGFFRCPAVKRTASSLSRRGSGSGVVWARRRSSLGPESSGAVFCHRCREQFERWEAVEEHHRSKHAVTDLVETDSSRKIIEIICRAAPPRPDNPRPRIERILKVHNMHKTIARFEEHRELVKARATKFPKKHPRCLADGNEHLRFHGSILDCTLGQNGSCGLCQSERCRVCRILRDGFSTKKEVTCGVGVFTASTSTRALESIVGLEGSGSQRRALVVCRVIAGRVHRAMENMEGMVEETGFDSVAGKVGVHSNIEELYVLSPMALLPCFVVICNDI